MEIYPRRLVWLQMSDNCMFCTDPKGESCMTYVALEAKMGYISCIDCREKMRAAVEYWRTHRAYGAANHLKDRSDLKVKRSNGEIEAGWCLNNPLTSYDVETGCETVRCYNKSQNIGKWCTVASILELNST